MTMMEEEDEDYFKPMRGPRPCCTYPAGVMSILAAVFSTFALLLSMTAQYSCKFIYSEVEYCDPSPEPEPAYACCGSCHCIMDPPYTDCPTTAPNMNISKDIINQFKSMKLLNTMNLTCNPYDTQYTGIPCETTPPQNFTELGDVAACGVLYDAATLDPGTQCPTQYRLESFPSVDAMEAAGAELTHYGACGVCSSTQDLAVYIENTDLTTLGVKCSISGIVELEQGIRCYQRAGYTRACAEMWVYNGLQTKDFCGSICSTFRLQKRPNNGPAPSCELDECLDCDETHAGPLFAKIAARSRRRSGLLSKIARGCDQILLVFHQNPCDIVRGAPRNYTQNNDVCDAIDPNYQYDDSPRCFTFTGGLGLMSHETVSTSKGLFDISLNLIPSEKDTLMTTHYSSCTRYATGRSVTGFWDDISTNYLGAPSFSIISTVAGSILLIFVWSAACFAFQRKFWFVVGGIYCVLGCLDFLTLVFFLSPICIYSNGTCQIGFSALIASAAGVFWFIAAAFCFRAGVEDKSMEYTSVATNRVVTEYVQPDGTKVIDTVSHDWTGRKITERRIFKKGQAKEAVAEEIEQVDGSSTEFHEADAIQLHERNGSEAAGVEKKRRGLLAWLRRLRDRTFPML